MKSSYRNNFFCFLILWSNREDKLPCPPLLRTVRATLIAHGSSTSQPDIGQQQRDAISLFRRAGIFHTTLSFDEIFPIQKWV